MKHLPSLVAVAALTAFGSAGAANANVVFALGNNPQSQEQNVLFGSSQTGATITGATNQSGTGIQVTSSQSLSTGGIGQAFLVATSGGLITDFTFTVPNHTFGDFIFNPMIGGQPPGGGGTANVVATANGTPFSFSYTLGNGNNFLTIFTTGGETLDAVTLSVTGAGFDQLKQLRVSGISGVVVPEPATLAVLGIGLTALGLVRRRKAWVPAPLLGRGGANRSRIAHTSSTPSYRSYSDRFLRPR
jgi:hypothetical protein